MKTILRKCLYALVATGGFFFLAFLVLEGVLRIMGYHQSVQYERVGDLLFTPVPGQQVLEKITGTPTRINRLGLRGAEVSADQLASRTVVLCLGDSVTHGYGVADAETYPHFLQLELDRRAPGKFLVLNGGVNAYPVSFMHEKYKYLRSRGVQPAVVVVGYSFNEGWLGHLTSASDDLKDAFERRVKLKNFARSWASYNVVVENWAKTYYDRYKSRLVPGTNTTRPSEVSGDDKYRAALDLMEDDLRRDGVRAVYSGFATLDGETGLLAPHGRLQKSFADWARDGNRAVLVAREKWAHLKDARPLYIDGVHLSPEGNRLWALELADFLVPAGE